MRTERWFYHLKMTYDTILGEMKNAFFEKCGENVEKYSELSARFEAVASEMYSLFCGCEFVLKQAFPQTASGSYLDFHARLRGAERKAASKARVMLTFSLGELSETDTVIDGGCICASKNNPFIQFVTLESAVIPAGELSVTTEAEAAECGGSYNVKAGEVTVIVNPPLTVAAVTNAAPHAFGFEAESDSRLRKRILSAYSIPSTGFSADSLRESVLAIDGVLDCSVSERNNTAVVSLKTADGEISEALREEIGDKLYIADIFGFNKEINLARKRDCALRISVKCSVSEFERIEEEVKDKVKEITESLLIGESLVLSSLSYAVFTVDGVEFCEVTSADAVDGIVVCSSDEFLTFDSIEVSCYE